MRKLRRAPCICALDRAVDFLFGGGEREIAKSAQFSWRLRHFQAAVTTRQICIVPHFNDHRRRMTRQEAASCVSRSSGRHDEMTPLSSILSSTEVSRNSPIGSWQARRLLVWRPRSFYTNLVTRWLRALSGCLSSRLRSSSLAASLKWKATPKAPTPELLMALAGPAVSVVLGFCFLALAALSSSAAPHEYYGVLNYLGVLGRHQSG